MQSIYTKSVLKQNKPNLPSLKLTTKLKLCCLTCCWSQKFDNASPFLVKIHGLPVQESIPFKIFLKTYKCNLFGTRISQRTFNFLYWHSLNTYCSRFSSHRTEADSKAW